MHGDKAQLALADHFRNGPSLTSDHETLADTEGASLEPIAALPDQQLEPSHADVAYNLFWRNRVAALLTDQTDFRRVVAAQDRIGPPRLIGNVDGSPEFVGRQPLPNSPLHMRSPLSKLVHDLIPRAGARQRHALDSGNADPAFEDLDETRNDLGFTGGPHAFVP